MQNQNLRKRTLILITAWKVDTSFVYVKKEKYKSWDSQFVFGMYYKYMFSVFYTTNPNWLLTLSKKPLKSLITSISPQCIFITSGSKTKGIMNSIESDTPYLELY